MPQGIDLKTAHPTLRVLRGNPNPTPEAAVINDGQGLGAWLGLTAHFKLSLPMIVSMHSQIKLNELEVFVLVAALQDVKGLLFAHFVLEGQLEPPVC